MYSIIKVLKTLTQLLKSHILSILCVVLLFKHYRGFLCHESLPSNLGSQFQNTRLVPGTGERWVGRYVGKQIQEVNEIGVNRNTDISPGLCYWL